MGVRPSLGSVGDAYDNAMCESFFGTLEAELLDRNTFRSQVDARMAIFRYIEGWYNPKRRHSSLGYLSPANFEARNRPESRASSLVPADVSAYPPSSLDRPGSTPLQSSGSF